MNIEKLNEKIDELLSSSNITGEEIVEIGVGLVARGIFRIGDSNHENNPTEAFYAGLNVASLFKELAYDFKNHSNDEVL